MKQLTILGSTGSIGCSTLDVVRHNPEHFRVVALVAGKNVTRMVEQCLEFSPRYAVMDDEASAKLLKTMLQQQGSRTEVLSGQQAACDMAALEDVDQVMAAIVGAAGLLPTLAAIRAGKTILLANKESLVTCGRLFMDAVKQSKAQLLPVDSEHNAIFQSLPQPIQHNLGYADLEQNGVVSILLTGSGGPFRETPLRDLATMTPDQACRHPNWSMGRKISVDSATMMNKGLEYIEARWLFNASASQMEVLIHPQSVIHSMVRYQDGSVLAQLGEPEGGKLETRLWGAVVIDGTKCVSCRMCATFCPTGAIAKFDDADGTLGVTHTPGDCVKCGSCRDVCPADAITLLDAVPASWLTGGNRHRYVMTPRPVSLTDNPHQILDTFRLDFNGDIFER